MQATAHSSYWQEELGGLTTRYPALDRDLRADVAIVGGGITGLTAALHLRKAGQRVVVLEAGQIGSGTTGSTSAHLDATTDTPLAELIANFGEDKSAVVAAANRQAIEQIEIRCLKYRDCEFRRVASYQFTESAAGLTGLQKQCAAARKLGFNCWFTRDVPLPFSCVGAVQTEQQGRFHPLRYLEQLAAELEAAGGEIFENTSAQPPDQADPMTVQTDGGRVQADAVFLATHSPFGGISQFDFRVFAYQSYMLAVRVQQRVADSLYWDDAQPYHYIRRASPTDESLLLVGGGDHKTGQPGDERERFDEVERYVSERFSIRSIEHRWSAQHFVPADGLPHVGRMPGSERIFLATGFAGTGLTWGTVAGTLVARLILGQEHPLEEILNPGRLTLMASARNVVSENLTVLRRFAVDRFVADPPGAEREIAPGHGRVLSFGGKLTAVHRDAAGQVHRCSPICTHAGCIVHWNEAEQTWDCPCHGGRYTALGQRFAGPPRDDMVP